MNMGGSPMNGGDQMKNGVLEQLAQFACEWIPEKAAFAVAADGHYIHLDQRGLDIPLVTGHPVTPGDIAHRVLETGRRAEERLSFPEQDASYYGIGYPVEIDSLPGAVIVLLPEERKTEKAAPIRYLTGRTDEDWVPVSVSRITHIESADKKTWFYADGEEFASTRTLKQLEAELPGSFLRVHRSYLINTDFISRIRKDDFTSGLLITTSDGSEIPVSQTHAPTLRKVLGF